MRGINRERVLRAVVEYAEKTEGRLTLRGLEEATGISFTQVYYWWPEGWFAVLDAAGLGERGSRLRPVSDHQLMAELDRVAEEIGRLPRWQELRLHGKHSPSVYQHRFRTWEGVERAYAKWCRERKGGEPKWKLPPKRTRRIVAKAPEWRAAEDEVLGAPLGLPAVSYAPTNEQGVVHLFGVLGESLGFVVERVGRGFPDCVALRRACGARELWERVRIEFEFRSGNFVQHGHDASGCDVIVCWEHDWEGCPLEVVELRRLVGRGAGGGA